jgi:glycosyltransferase involved in cell wall biosynthesis
VDLARIRLVHAHFLYSDGAVALALKQEFGLPFIVAVRNTDVNAFMRYRPDLARTRDRVLAEAEKVVFLSHAYRSLLARNLDAGLRERVAAKSIIVPNGIGDDWLAEQPPAARHDPQALRLLYVGDYSANKNIPILLDAVGLVAKSRDVSLTLVGGSGDGAEQVSRLLRSGRFPFARNVGRVSDPQKLRGIYRDHDVFVMVSHLETFGVVYIEALSQGLPIVHSRGQGVDGYFEPATVAEAANPKDPADIAARLVAVAGRLPGIRARCMAEAQRFDWRHIATAYSLIYNAAALPPAAIRPEPETSN